MTIAMIEMIRKRRLPVVRDDTGQLPVIHIEDAVSATIRALDQARAGTIYDIVDDRAVSMTEIVETIAHFTGSAAPLKVPAWLPGWWLRICRA
jgi:nucleoside-diphosphate-sugar epimerase